MNYSNNVYFKKFGLEIGKEFIEVKAKVLKAPVLDIGGGQTILPRYDIFLLKFVWFFTLQTGSLVYDILFLNGNKTLKLVVMPLAGSTMLFLH